MTTFPEAMSRAANSVEVPFVDRQNDGMIGRVQIQAYRVAHFFHEERAFGEIEVPAAVRLNGEQLEDPVHGGPGKTVCLRGQADGSVSSRGRLLLQSATQQDGDLLIGNRARLTGAKLIVDAGQLLPLLSSQFQSRRRPSHRHTLPHRSSLPDTSYR